ncbi:GNAT family N-acetyltransferase [Micromonospora krabiensis]|uniref:Protein N-acetyltransferase, RimJ/RimL family n=1 Tax=Micromonospora krabiensis TaxID=307121 RepID=A0A1C3N7D8_9ACTN|nr:GNAT family protein [Micromonospora krabiensis]SBV28488.1 Protein N-acetyltransferase, RimJ/RimL family [Micromonospora krabiensis]
MIVEHWPLLGLRVRTERLELRLPTDDELAALADLAARGVHPPDERPFLTPWTDLPPRDLARGVVQRHWRDRGLWTPQQWTLELAVFEGGRPVGVQQVRGRDFAVLREVRSASWLGLDHQGRGIGREMRAGMLHLAFAGLGAEHAVSESFADNPAPLAVSRALGYRPDGISRDAVGTEVRVSQRLRLTRQDWLAGDRPQVSLDGLDACRELFGTDPADQP